MSQSLEAPGPEIDIVDVLRGLAYVVDHYCGRASVTLTESSVLTEAADEIQRLRRLIRSEAPTVVVRGSTGEEYTVSASGGQ